MLQGATRFHAKICKNHIIVTINQSWCILHFDIIYIHWYSLIFYQALSQAWLQFLVYSPPCEETKRPRMSSGETAFHVTRWAKHAFQLSAKPSPQDSKDGADLCAKKTGDLRKIYMSFIWVLLHATTICQTSACTKCAKWISMIIDMERATFTKWPSHWSAS